MMMQPNAHNYFKKGKNLRIENLHADAAPELLGGAPLLPEPDILQNPMRFSKNFRN
jgi:hypothetical protein